MGLLRRKKYKPNVMLFSAVAFAGDSVTEVLKFKHLLAEEYDVFHNYSKLSLA